MSGWYPYGDLALHLVETLEAGKPVGALCDEVRRMHALATAAEQLSSCGMHSIERGDVDTAQRILSILWLIPTPTQEAQIALDWEIRDHVLNATRCAENE